MFESVQVKPRSQRWLFNGLSGSLLGFLCPDCYNIEMLVLFDKLILEHDKKIAVQHLKFYCKGPEMFDSLRCRISNFGYATPINLQDFGQEK